MHTKEIQDNHFIGSLEELGLTKYEAGAYLSMIQKGSCPPSEIAYHSNVPRTKIYSILKRLEKKQLCILSQQKPLVFSPVPPAEAFHEILKLSERRVKNMKKIVDLLQGINDEVHKPIGSEERRYTLFNPRSAFPKINSLISGCKSRIDSSLDTWGIRLISQCRDSLIKAITNGVKIRLVVGYDCAGSEMIRTLPGDIDLKMGDVKSSIIIIDASNAVLLDSRNGKAAIFDCTDILRSL
jgi:sugar-specific transcriptional regulator TrmB